MLFHYLLHWTWMLQRHAPLLQLPLTLHDPFLNSRNQSEGSFGEAAANRKLSFMAHDQGNGAALSNDHDLHKLSSLLFSQK
jgi:hypothetical protein